MYVFIHEHLLPYPPEFPGTLTHSYAPAFHLLTPSDELGLRTFRTPSLSFVPYTATPSRSNSNSNSNPPSLSPRRRALKFDASNDGCLSCLFYVWGCKLYCCRLHFFALLRRGTGKYDGNRRCLFRTVIYGCSHDEFLRRFDLLGIREVLERALISGFCGRTTLQYLSTRWCFVLC